MNNHIYMTAEFERDKLKKASAITLGVAGLLMLIFFLIKWPIPNVEPALDQEIIEVNLGSGDEGFGTDQPMLPGEPAPAQQEKYTPPQPVHAVTSNAKDVETDDRPTNEAPAIIKPAITRTEATKINETNETIKTTNTTATEVVKQAPPRPKAVLGKTTGGNGNGGNGADSYQKGGNEGIAGGNGDQGVPGGDPNSRNYNGARKSFGVKVLQISDQSFEDDFNENAKVAMDVVADERGKVLSATFQPKGSTTSNRKMIDIARNRAFELKLGSADGGQRGTVIFNFKLRG